MLLFVVISAVMLVIQPAQAFQTSSDSNAPESAVVDRVVAEFDGEPVTLQEVDAVAPQRIGRLRESLQKLLREKTAEWVMRQPVTNEFLAKGNLTIPELSKSDALDRYGAEIEKTLPSGSNRDSVKAGAIERFLQQHRSEQRRDSSIHYLLDKKVLTLSTRDSVDLTLPLKPDVPLADLAGNSYSGGSFEADAKLQLYRLRGQIVRQRQRNLATLEEQYLLAKAARLAGKSLDELLIERSTAQVTNDSISEYQQQQRSRGEAVSSPEQIRPYLEYQQRFAARMALLEELRAQSQVKSYLEQPEEPRFIVADNVGLVLHSGQSELAKASTNEIVLFSNYRCIACREQLRLLDDVIREYPDLRLRVVQLIPVFDPVAEQAATLLHCAAIEGDLMAMHKQLLASPVPGFSQAWFEERNQGVGASAPNDVCIKSETTQQWLASERAASAAIGLSEAPAVLLDGKVYSGQQKLLELIGTMASFQ